MLGTPLTQLLDRHGLWRIGSPEHGQTRLFAVPTSAGLRPQTLIATSQDKGAGRGARCHADAKVVLLDSEESALRERSAPREVEEEAGKAAQADDLERRRRSWMLRWTTISAAAGLRPMAVLE